MIVVTALIACGVLMMSGGDWDDSETLGGILTLCGLVGGVAFFWFGRRKPQSSPSIPNQRDSGRSADNRDEDLDGQA